MTDCATRSGPEGISLLFNQSATTGLDLHPIERQFTKVNVSSIAKMLSTNSTSSIQKRRQQHRRQQSLEVPILATPLPANPRRNRPAHQAHRRGLSLDQSLSALNSPSGLRPLLPQDQDQGQFNGFPPVRIQLDTTNTGHHPQDQQHFVQETQQHRPVQPGYQAQDFQSHLQQQLHGSVSPAIVAPTPTHPNQEQALQELQSHLEWYQQNYGHSPAPTMQNTNFFNLNQPMANEMAMNPMEAQMQQHSDMRMHTPVSHGHARTVPNTPQQYVQSWPSPPPTEIKHTRSQSFQCDVAPMPTTFDGAHVMKVTASPYSQPQGSFTQDSFAMSDTVYSSSLVDPMSPSRQNNIGAMPTLFEEPTPPLDNTKNGFSDDALLQATAGAEDDFNSPSFVVGGPLGVSPHTAMLHNLGEDVNASIIDTGIPPEEIDACISQQHSQTKFWYCLFELDNGKTCNKWFKRKENARSHVQNHLGDRQFQCNDCGKTFVRQHDMKRHAAIHNDNRPHVCPCGSGFARHDALTRHRQRGMCEGALPGFEKNEEDKPKRGRPKKERPDMESRTTKARKARQMDQENENVEVIYASSSSGMSEHSLPVTPPDTSDFDADAFINMANVDVHFNSHTSSWRDTPPTSPATASPHKTFVQDHGISPALLTDHSSPAQHNPCVGFTGASSPENGSMFGDGWNFGAIEAQPGVAAKDLFSDALSPEYGGSDPCSPFAGDEALGTVQSVSWMVDVVSAAAGESGGLAEALDRWLSTH